MSTFQTQGLVLSSRDFREADKIFSIYTNTHGKIEALAAGVRKIKSKLRAHLEPFSVVDLMIAHGRRHDRLTSAVSQKSYSKIKSSYELLIINYQLLELVDQLTKLHHPDSRIFNLLKELFYFIENNEAQENELRQLRAHFILNFLSYLGYTPELKTCIRCKSSVPSPTHFSFSDGSIICEKCVVTADQLISADSIEIFKKYLNCNLSECHNFENNECCKLVDGFLSYHLDRPLKSEVFTK